MPQDMYKTTITFGKHDWNGCGKKINLCAIRVTLRRTGRAGEEYWKFSCAGFIWNARGTSAICQGQCLDEMYNRVPALQTNQLFCEIYHLWKKYHLNDMHPGTAKQEAILQQQINALRALLARAGEPYENITSFSYTEAVNRLTTAGYYIDTYQGKPYKYGQGFTLREIPEVIVKRIIEIILQNNGGETINNSTK